MSLKSDKDKLAFDLQELQNDKTSMQRDMKEQTAKLGEQKEALGIYSSDQPIMFKNTNTHYIDNICIVEIEYI